MRQEGERVLLLHNGACYSPLPWQAALTLRVLCAQGKRAEELMRCGSSMTRRVTRVGFPIGLSNRRDILAEAAKEGVES